MANGSSTVWQLVSSSQLLSTIEGTVFFESWSRIGLQQTSFQRGRNRRRTKTPLQLTLSIFFSWNCFSPHRRAFGEDFFVAGARAQTPLPIPASPDSLGYVPDVVPVSV